VNDTLDRRKITASNLVTLGLKEQMGHYFAKVNRDWTLVFRCDDKGFWSAYVECGYQDLDDDDPEDTDPDDGAAFPFPEPKTMGDVATICRATGAKL
jgi:hypothetical protein